MDVATVESLLLREEEPWDDERTRGMTTMSTQGSPSAPCTPEAVTVDSDEGERVFDRVARRKLGISGHEFLRRWDAGEYRGTQENVRAQEVAMLMPLARPVLADAR